MIVTGHEAFLLTLLFGVTGYITHSVVSRFTFRRSERPELLLLRLVAYGTVNALVALPFVVLHTRLLPRETWATFLTQNMPTYYELTFWILFLIPIGLGLLFGVFHYLYDAQTWYRAPIAAWDERIARSRGQWVLISLEGDAQVAGFLGRASSIVSDTGDKDLYLETAWSEEEDGTWRKVPRSKGMLISGKIIQSIEFWEDEAERPDSMRERLSSLVFPKGRHVPPDFRSSIITPSPNTTALGPQEVLEEAMQSEENVDAAPAVVSERGVPAVGHSMIGLHTD